MDRLWIIAIGFALFTIIAPQLLIPFCKGTCGWMPKAFLWIVSLIFTYLFFLNLYIYIGDMLETKITKGDIKRFTVYFIAIAMLFTLLFWIVFCSNGCNVQVIYLK